jgi:transposase InsO family protein
MYRFIQPIANEHAVRTMLRLLGAAVLTTSGCKQVRKRRLLKTDRSGQYAGKKFRKLINDNRLLQSMSRADNPYDNAYMESWFSRIEAGLLQGDTSQNREDAQTEIFKFIKKMYSNTKRR